MLGILDWLPTIEINDHQVNFFRVVAIFIGTFIGGGLAGWIVHQLNFFRGSDPGSIEMFGVAHELIDPKDHGGKSFMLTADAWGRVEDVRTTTIGPSNPRLADILVKAIARAPAKFAHDEPYVRIPKRRNRWWIERKLDAAIDGNDWTANPARVKGRAVHKDRFGCCLFGPRNGDGIKTGIGIIFDDEMANTFADDSFPSKCLVADEWAVPELPRLLHLAAKAWLDRKDPVNDVLTWTATVTSRV